MTAPIVLIKSASDIGSAVAHRLKQAGYAPILLESPTPGATRRLMSFAGAVHAGTAELEGLRAVRCAAPAEALLRAQVPGEIPLLVVQLDEPLPEPLAQAATALVDARMRKKRTPPVQLGQAPLVIGIGPGFVAGVHSDLVIESNHGPELGRVIREGTSQAYTGKHRVIEGLGKERYLYAPHAGTFHTDLDILAPVQAGDVVGRVNETPLAFQADGILRGLAYDGLVVEEGAKLVEIDPSSDPANCRGIAGRPAGIAEGVLKALRDVHPQ